jgi:hypothetical protein
MAVWAPIAVIGATAGAKAPVELNRVTARADGGLGLSHCYWSRGGRRLGLGLGLGRRLGLRRGGPSRDAGRLRAGLTGIVLIAERAGAEVIVVLLSAIIGEFALLEPGGPVVANVLRDLLRGH